MAENKSKGAQHLTSLDLDISGVLTSLEEAKNQIEKYSIESGKSWIDNLNKSADQSGAAKFDVSKIIDNTKLEEAKKSLEELAIEMGKFSKTAVQQKGDSVLGSITYDDSSGKKLIAQYELIGNEWEKISTKQINDIEKREKLEQKELERSQKIKDSFYQKNSTQIDVEIKKREEAANRFSAQLKAQMELEQSIQNKKDSFYQKNLSQIDAEIIERERQSKIFSSQIKEQIQSKVKEEKYQQKVSSQIESQIEKQKQFNTLVSNQRTSPVNKGILADSNALIKSLDELNKKLKEQGYVTESQEKQLENYKRQIKELGGYYQEAGAKGESFLQKIGDKAKWLGAFYVVNELKNGLIAAVETLKQTEDAVVSLQRVLNDNSVSQSAMSEELYNIAYEYGRSFSDVAEVSQQFAQAGYDWKDTIELTKGTMLALNTAELDVTQSTKGLIAVLHQWNLEAEDYADVIDKINVTADNFAVTSETIVAALQRASSSASNANISLEQTIGIITALAEATGRSGENIGTALNSLIIYTSKASALETFAKVGSDAMDKVVDDYNRGAASIYDVLVQLSKELSNLTAQQQSVLFQSDEFQSFASEMESQAEEYTSQIKDIYGSAGTYRQNYFIALLNDLSKANEAVEGMADSEGYSLNENERYMQSLTANIEQLKAMLAELSVQLGEAGLMDILKFLVEASTGVVKLTKDLGGIVPVLQIIGGIVLAVKRQKIVDNLITPASTGIQKLRLQLNLFSLEMKNATTVSEKFKTATNLLFGSFTSILGVTGLAISAFTTLSSVVNIVKQKEEERREEVIKTNNEELERVEKLKKLIDSYDSLSQKTTLTIQDEKDLKDANEQIIKLLGSRTSELEGLTAGTNEYNEKLKEVIKNEIELSRTQAESNVKYAKEELSKSSSGVGAFSLTSDGLRISIQETKTGIEEVDSLVQSTLDKYSKLSTVWGVDFFAPLSDSASDIIEFLATLETLQSQIESIGESDPEIAKKIGGSRFWELLSDGVSSVEDKIGNLIKEEIRLAEIDLGVPETVNDLKEFASVISSNLGVGEEFSGYIQDLVEEQFPELEKAANNFGDSISNSFSISESAIKELNDSLKELNDSVDAFQSGFNIANEAMSEYNENGYLSVDTIQALLSAGTDYVSLLNFTANGIELNKEKTRNLLETQKNNIDAMIKQSATAGLLEIAQRYLGESTEDVGEKSENAAPSVGTLESKLSDLANQAVSATFSVAAAGNAIEKAFSGKVTGNNLKSMKKEMTDYLSSIHSMSNSIGHLTTNTDAWSKGASKASESVSKAAEKAEKERTAALKKQLEAQKKAVKERYDAEIDKLKKVQEENDRLQKQEEYYRNRKEALKDISKAETRSGVEYREQEEEARNKLEELDRDWQETVADWSIEDKIDELESLRDAEIAAIDAQISALEQKTSAIGSAMVESSSVASKQMANNYDVEYLEPITKETKESFDSMYSDLPKIYANEAKQILEIAKLNSMQMYNVYNENFFSKVQQSMLEIRRSMIGISGMSQLNPFSFFPVGNNYSTSNIVNNNTNNANVFANVYDSNSANSLGKSIFRKP